MAIKMPIMTTLCWNLFYFWLGSSQFLTQSIRSIYKRITKIIIYYEKTE